MTVAVGTKITVKNSQPSLFSDVTDVEKQVKGHIYVSSRDRQEQFCFIPDTGNRQIIAVRQFLESVP